MDNLQEDENVQNTTEDEVPMDWNATDKTGILNELKQCRDNLELYPSSKLAEFPENMFDNRYEYYCSNITINGIL